jgi:hypothetical protein
LRPLFLDSRGGLAHEYTILIRALDAMGVEERFLWKLREGN